MATPHQDKIIAAIDNPKCEEADRALLRDALETYHAWIADTDALTSEGKERVVALVNLLNRYKDTLEVDLIAKRGSPFLRRQKGQLKLDNSVLEEFFPRLVHPSTIQGLGDTRFFVGPQTAFASLSFRPRSFSDLDKKPEVVLKLKDQDFVLGAPIHYRFATTQDFSPSETSGGQFVLAIMAAELKVNLDKTMYQEAVGTSAALKMGCPIAKYFLIAEYLDMEPQDPRLTEIDNVLLLRHAHRLSPDKRSDPAEVERQHRDYPIDPEIVWRFVEEIQSFVNVTWYDPDAALKRGSFI